MTILREDMLTAFAGIDYHITTVLQDWIQKEYNNLQSYIDTPNAHVDYNKYVVPDFTALNNRLSMLQSAEGHLDTINRYKQGDSTITDGMYEDAIDNIPVIIFSRLLEWTAVKVGQMDEVLHSASPTDAPLSDYYSLYTFNYSMFQQEYQVFTNSLAGLQSVVEYKNQ